MVALSVDTTNVSINTSLARFLRQHLHLTGTKISCEQAGCGACVVTATFVDPATQETKTRSVNSVRRTGFIFIKDFQRQLKSWERENVLYL
jgi:aerobic-type carbon monoxide dehydrogenase small subunit (CoxS/CutS family)